MRCCSMIFSPAPSSTSVVTSAPYRPGRGAQVRNISRPDAAGATGIAVEQRIRHIGLALPNLLQLVQRLARRGRNRDLAIDEHGGDAYLNPRILVPAVGQLQDV